MSSHRMKLDITFTVACPQPLRIVIAQETELSLDDIARLAEVDAQTARITRRLERLDSKTLPVDSLPG